MKQGYTVIAYPCLNIWKNHLTKYSPLYPICGSPPLEGLGEVFIYTNSFPFFICTSFTYFLTNAEESSFLQISNTLSFSAMI